MKNPIKLIISISLPLLVGYVGSTFTRPEIAGWYAGLVKPALNPPAWIFGPVWTLLYILMGVAFYLIWTQHTNILENVGMRWGMTLWGVQLALNLYWSFIFFGQHLIGGALIEIIFLWLAILATILAFKKVSRTAAWLMLPYILWVSFATYLNWSIWMLN